MTGNKEGEMMNDVHKGPQLESNQDIVAHAWCLNPSFTMPQGTVVFSQCDSDRSNGVFAEDYFCS